MIGNLSMEEYSWQGSALEIEKLVINLPSSFVESCPDLLSNDDTVDQESIQSSINQRFISKLTSWISEQRFYLEKKYGVLLIRINHEGLSDKQLKSLYYIISSGLGKLNDRYGELFDVRDKNLDYKKEAIPVSLTSASTGFHTDSTALEYSPDIVGLLCLQPAKIGGESIFANAADLYLWMKQFYPEDLNVLTKPIIRDVITPGSHTDIDAIKKNRFPVFSFVNDVFKFRYMRYWIISGHNRCNIEIPTELTRALERIDEFFQNKKNLAFYRMVRGEILYVNNNFICHNRTKYEDYDEAERKRTLVRTWIN